jgi:predicted RNA-binding Zn ribbon-like protein
MTSDPSAGEVLPPGAVERPVLTIGLDFANTAEWHAGPTPDEQLTSYHAAVAWAREGGILNEAQAESLLAGAQARPAEEKEALGRIIALREAVYRIFTAVAHDRPPDPVDLQVLNLELRQALVHLRLDAAPESPPARADAPGASPVPGGVQQFAWTWTGVEDDLTSLLWPVARAAASLLTSAQLPRVRECAGHPCGWLFLDHSKNGSRRWCDMASCGNRAKARRHRERGKGEGQGR